MNWHFNGALESIHPGWRHCICRTCSLWVIQTKKSLNVRSHWMSKNKLLTILNIFSVRLPVKCPGYQSPIGTNLLSISISKFPNKQIIKGHSTYGSRWLQDHPLVITKIIFWQKIGYLMSSNQSNVINLAKFCNKYCK